MPWRSEAPAHGFTTGTPWLPAAPEHATLTVDRQEADPDSPLAFARQVIALRKASPALKWGKITFLDAPAPILAFAREADGEMVVAMFNMSAEPATWAEIPGGELKAITGEVLDGTFQPYSAMIIRT
jgi:alpha-glucosidase